jgi:signal transduction histidine kinase/ActR/RegA family two-component response regulator
MVKERTLQLEEINTVLEEKQEEIYIQNEELMSQKDHLQEVNRTLEEQAEEIESQNNELHRHRNHLEQLVKERTEELVDAMKKVMESDQLKSAFLANMSHEIRTPMNAILGFSSLLNEPEVTEKEKEEFIKIIMKNGESLLVLINDIIEMSKIQSNQLDINNKQVNVTEILEELLVSFRLQAKPKGIALIMDVGIWRDRLICSLDSVRFKQILSNLINNSIKFTEKGFVKFGVKAKNKDFVTFYVQDTGIGIPEEAGNSIFERFLKIESMETKFYEGVGLGLSICNSLVKAMGGKIWYESKLGQGTSFYFNIPSCDKDNIAMPGNKEKDGHEKHEVPNLEDRHIMIVEDERNNYQLLLVYLQRTKATLTWARNGLEAIEYYKNNNHFDLILMDLKMPFMDGIEAARIIRQINPMQPIVAQTAFAYKEDKEEFLKNELDGFLEKPVSRGALMNILNKVFKSNGA